MKCSNGVGGLLLALLLTLTIRNKYAVVQAKFMATPRSMITKSRQRALQGTIFTDSDLSNEPSSAPTTSSVPSLSPAPSISQGPSFTPTTIPSVTPSAAPTPEVVSLRNGFEELEEKISPYADDEGLNRLIPIVGVDINKLIAGDDFQSISSLVDLSEFVPEEATREELQDFLIGNFTARVNQLGGTLSFSDQSSLCKDLHDDEQSPIVVIDIGDNESTNITFCSQVTFSKTVNFETEGLFDSIERNVLIETTAEIDIDVNLHFFARISTQDNGNDITATVDPITASVTTTKSSVSLDLIVGIIRLTSNANLEVDVLFNIGDCEGNKCLKSTSSKFMLSGDLQPSTSFTVNGVDLQIEDDASFDIQASNMISNLNFEVFDILGVDSSFELFTPGNALNSMLRVFDSAFIRSQENEVALTRSFPLSDSSFAKNLFTGSFLTSQRSRFFAKPARFDRRPQQSTTLIASERVSNENSGEGTKLRLLVVRDELLGNPENYEELLELEDISFCDFELEGPDEITNESNLVDDLLAKIKSADCSGEPIRICTNDATSRCQTKASNSDVFGCEECDIVVGINSNSFTFLASNAIFSDGTVNDVTLVGLYNITTEFSQKGASNVYGLPINAPAFTTLVPRFSDFSAYVSGIRRALENRFRKVGVNFAYVNLNDGSRPRFEVDLSFSAEKAISANWNIERGLGDFQGITLGATSALDAKTSVDFSGKIAVALGPNDVDQITYFAKACNGTGFECPIEGFTFEIDFTIDGTSSTEEFEVTASTGTVNAREMLLAVLRSKLGDNVLSVTETGNATLAVLFDSDVTDITIRVPKNCLDPITREILAGPVAACTEAQIVDLIPNSFGLRDAALSKTAFEIQVGDISIKADIAVGGNADFNAALNDVIEVEASLTAEMDGTLDITLGNGDLTRFTDWLTLLAGLRTNNFMTASNSWNAAFTATVDPLAPFNFPDALGISVSGSFQDFEVDFFGEAGYPDIQMVVDLPGIGNISQLSYGKKETLVRFSM